MRGWIGALALLVTGLVAASSARAEVDTVRLAHQPGMGHLELRIMEADRLIEQQAEAAGLEGVTVEWRSFASQVEMDAALDAGALDIASGDTAELIRRWSETKGAVVGLAANSALPLVLTTNRPDLHTLDDFTARDRIALPTPVRSLEALLLAVGLERRGAQDANRLVRLQVGLKRPDAMAALIGGTDGITADFAAPPFLYQELALPKIHRVFAAADVLPVGTTTGVVWGNARFFADNPRVTEAVLAALEAASQVIRQNPRRAAEIYLAAEQPGWSRMEAEITLRNPSHGFGTAPVEVMAVVKAMATLGLKPVPTTWQDLFTPALRSRLRS